MLHEHLAICENQLTSRKRKRSFTFEIAGLLCFMLRDRDRRKHGRATGDSEDGGSQGESRCIAWMASGVLGLPSCRLNRHYRSLADQMPHTAT